MAADFEDQMDRTSDNHLLYARMIGTIARQEGIRPLDRAGVARVIEQSARLAGDADKLSTHVHTLPICCVKPITGPARRSILSLMPRMYSTPSMRRFGVWIVASTSRKRSNAVRS